MQTTATRWITVFKTTKCKTCGSEINFQKSQRTGKWYPTEVYTVSGTNEKFTGQNHFHTCTRPLTPQEEVDKDIRFKNACAEIENRQEARVFQAKMNEEERLVEEALKDQRSKYEAEMREQLTRIDWESKKQIGHTQSAWYDHTFYKVKVNGKIDTSLIRNAINCKWQVGANAASLGKFGGWCSIGDVTDNGDSTITIEEIYHIGD